MLFAWEASLFHDNRSGRVEVRLHPVQAEHLVELIRRRDANAPAAAPNGKPESR